MAKEELTREELIAINLNDILYYLQSEEKFLELYEHPTDKVINREIRIMHKAEEDTPQFLDHLKRIQEIYERRDELAKLIATLGNTREEMLGGIGTIIYSSPKVMRAYEDFLERYSHPKAYPELKGVESWRIKPETLEGRVSLGPIDLCDSGGIPSRNLDGMYSLDRQYCNAYPKRESD